MQYSFIKIKWEDPKIYINLIKYDDTDKFSESSAILELELDLEVESHLEGQASVSDLIIFPIDRQRIAL